MKLIEKFLILALGLLMVGSLITGCSTVAKGKSAIRKNVVNHRLLLDKTKIQQISIGTNQESFKEFIVVEKEKIGEIADYLTSLELTETKKYPATSLNDIVSSCGGDYIKIQFNDGTERSIYLNGNTTLEEKGQHVCTLKYEQVVKFGNLVARILESYQIEKGEPSIDGVVVWVRTATEGNIVLEDEQNKIYTINVEDADILDEVGSEGRMGTYAGDTVRVFYKMEDKRLVSTGIYIKKGPLQNR